MFLLPHTWFVSDITGVSCRPRDQQFEASNLDSRSKRKLHDKHGALACSVPFGLIACVSDRQWTEWLVDGNASRSPRGC